MNKNKDNSKWVWAGIGLLAIALTIASFALPVKEWAEAFQHWIEGFGAWGAVIFGVIYIVAVVLLVPAGPLTIAAGLAFGAWAFPLVVVAATIGAALAFLAARYIAGKKVNELIKNRPKWNAVHKAVGSDGWKIVGLLRLSPVVPFSLQNYALGVCEIGFIPYVLSTFFGIMPGTLLYVYLGVVGQQASQGTSAAKWGIYALGLVATIVATILITRKAKAELKKSGLGSGSDAKKK